MWRASSASAISAPSASRAASIVDLEAAETAIRQAVHAAERMAKVEIQSVIVNLTGGRLGSEHFDAQVAVRGAVGAGDVHRVLDAASSHDLRQGRAVLHALPTGFSLDAQNHIVDPAGMIGERLGVDLHVVTSEAAAARNLMLAVERCHLGVEAVVATPYAAGLSALVDDEADMGCAVVDMGGGTTSVGVFSNGHLVHADAIAVGGHHVTMDIARGLTTRVSAAERLKTLYGSAIVVELGRPRHDRGAAGRRGRARRSEPSAEIAPRAHHQAAGRGDPRTRARPAEEARALRPRPDGASC